MKNLLRHLVREEEGQDLIEYGLLAAFVAMVVVGSAIVLGTNLNLWYEKMATNVAGWQPS